MEATVPDAGWPSRSFGFLANQLARLVTAELARALRPLGLAPAQFVVLEQLRAAGASTQTELAEQLGVEQPTMARTLQRMARDGLVEHTSRAGDRRARPVALSAEGRRVLGPARDAAVAVNAAVLDDLGASERDELLATMGRLVDRLRDRRPDQAASTGSKR